MKEQGEVIALNNDIVTLKVIKKPECGGCKACFFGKGENSSTIKAKNTIQAKIGDQIYFVVQKDNSLKAYFIVYLLPILFMGLGVLFSALLLKKEIYIVLSAIIGLAIGFFILFLIDKFIAKSKNFQIELISIVPIEELEKQSIDRCTQGNCVSVSSSITDTDSVGSSLQINEKNKKDENKGELKMLKIVNTEEFNKIMQEEKNIVVDFWATWCGPCKALAPILENVAEEMQDFTFLKVDVDENSELAQKYSIMTIPTLLFIKDGEVVDKSVGLLTKEQLMAFVQKNI